MLWEHDWLNEYRVKLFKVLEPWFVKVHREEKIMPEEPNGKKGLKNGKVF